MGNVLNRWNRLFTVSGESESRCLLLIKRLTDISCSAIAHVYAAAKNLKLETCPAVTVGYRDAYAGGAGGQLPLLPFPRT